MLIVSASEDVSTCEVIVSASEDVSTCEGISRCAHEAFRERPFWGGLSVFRENVLKVRPSEDVLDCEAIRRCARL